MTLNKVQTSLHSNFMLKRGWLFDSLKSDKFQQEARGFLSISLLCEDSLQKIQQVLGTEKGIAHGCPTKPSYLVNR